MFNVNKYTKWVTIGWWLSFCFFMLQGFILNCMCSLTSPWAGLITFVIFTALSIPKIYNKKYRYSPYSAPLKMLQKSKH